MRPPGFSYRLNREVGQAVIWLFGELDMASAPELADCLQRLLDGPIQTVVVDLSGLGFCDSSGLNVLLRTHQQATTRGVRVVVRSPKRNVRRILELTHTTELLEGDSQ